VDERYRLIAYTVIITRSAGGIANVMYIPEAIVEMILLLKDSIILLNDVIY